MGDLEKYIREHRLRFDSEQPPSGHFDRFRERLNEKPVRRIRIRHAIQVAASVAVILASAFVIVNQSRNGDRMAEREIPEAWMEADRYYASQMDERYEQIRNFTFEKEEEKTLLLHELEDLDVRHQQLMSDLQAHPDDERVINALIRHYQLKLEVMDQIIRQLKQFKNEKSENHEKEHA
ncbi:MAG: hypothetical protein R6U78_17805 [Bacteroidales bacterium]